MLRVRRFTFFYRLPVAVAARGLRVCRTFGCAWLVAVAVAYLPTYAYTTCITATPGSLRRCRVTARLPHMRSWFAHFGSAWLVTGSPRGYTQFTPTSCTRCTHGYLRLLPFTPHHHAGSACYGWLGCSPAYCLHLRLQFCRTCGSPHRTRLRIRAAHGHAAFAAVLHVLRVWLPLRIRLVIPGCTRVHCGLPATWLRFTRSNIAPGLHTWFTAHAAARCPDAGSFTHAPAAVHYTGSGSGYLRLRGSTRLRGLRAHAPHRTRSSVAHTVYGSPHRVHAVGFACRSLPFCRWMRFRFGCHCFTATVPFVVLTAVWFAHTPTRRRWITHVTFTVHFGYRTLPTFTFAVLVAVTPFCRYHIYTPTVRCSLRLRCVVRRLLHFVPHTRYTTRFTCVGCYTHHTHRYHTYTIPRFYTSRLFARLVWFTRTVVLTLLRLPVAARLLRSTFTVTFTRSRFRSRYHHIYTFDYTVCRLPLYTLRGSVHAVTFPAPHLCGCGLPAYVYTRFRWTPLPVVTRFLRGWFPARFTVYTFAAVPPHTLHGWLYGCWIIPVPFHTFPIPHAAFTTTVAVVTALPTAGYHRMVGCRLLRSYTVAFHYAAVCSSLRTCGSVARCCSPHRFNDTVYHLRLRFAFVYTRLVRILVAGTFCYRICYCRRITRCRLRLHTFVRYTTGYLTVYGSTVVLDSLPPLQLPHGLLYSYTYRFTRVHCVPGYIRTRFCVPGC